MISVGGETSTEQQSMFELVDSRLRLARSTLSSGLVVANRLRHNGRIVSNISTVESSSLVTHSCHAIAVVQNETASLLKLLVQASAIIKA